MSSGSHARPGAEKLGALVNDPDCAGVFAHCGVSGTHPTGASAGVGSLENGGEVAAISMAANRFAVAAQRAADLLSIEGRRCSHSKTSQ